MQSKFVLVAVFLAAFLSLKCLANPVADDVNVEEAELDDRECVGEGGGGGGLGLSSLSGLLNGLLCPLLQQLYNLPLLGGLLEVILTLVHGLLGGVLESLVPGLLNCPTSGGLLR